jgi:hypothetical protein
MDKATARLVLMVGTIVYVAATVLALLTYVVNGALISFATLGIAIQVVLGLPLLAMLFMGAKFPALDYAKWLAATVSVLAVAGYVGIPRGSYEQRGMRLGFESDEQAIREDMGALETLELKEDLADADGDDKKEIEEKLKKVGNDLSKEDKEELQKKAAVLDAKKNIEQFKGASRAKALHAGEGRNGLIILGAFLALAGAYGMRREEETAAPAA